MVLACRSFRFFRLPGVHLERETAQPCSVWLNENERQMSGRGSGAACCLRAVNAIKSAFCELACHLSLCIYLKLRFLVIPSALTKPNIHGVSRVRSQSL